MTLRRYTVNVVRHETQTVTYTADDSDMDGSDMQRAIAHAYAKHHLWVRSPGLEISGLSQVPIAAETPPSSFEEHNPDRDPLHVAPHQAPKSETT
jgi:hypothetical protein